MKCGWFAALSVAFLIVLSGGSSASAASPFDGYVFTTEELLLSNKVTYGVPANLSDDYATSWYSLVQEYCDPEDNTIDFEGAYMVLQNFDRRLDRQINSILVYWDNRPSTEKKLTWTSWSSYREIAAPVQYAFHIYLTGDSAGDIGCNFETVNSDRLVANQNSNDPDGQNTTIFLSTYDANYPEEYEGQEIPAEIDNVKPIMRPDFTYTVTDKDVQAKDHKKDLPAFDPDEGYTFEGYEVEWSLFKDSELIDHEILLQEKEYTFTVEEYGDYKLRANYLVQQCYRYPSWPATPDNCFYVDLGTEFVDIDFTSTTVNIVIDGGSSSGNTVLLECDIAGVCSLPAETPASLFFNSMDNLNTHGLTQFFTAPITFLGTLPSMAESCTPITFPLMGQTISLECLKPRYYDWSTAIMNIYTTLLIAGTGYLIAFNLFRHIKDINTPDKDKIEVARL